MRDYSIESGFSMLQVSGMKKQRGGSNLHPEEGAAQRFNPLPQDSRMISAGSTTKEPPSD